MKIQTVNTSGYGALICSYFEKNFPNVAKPNKESVLEILAALIIGTKENRYGPAPKPEYQVVIRNTIENAIAKNEPIPFLIPWGGRKTEINQSIDIAEVSALYQIINLDHAIRLYYEPGLRANIRVEDTGAEWLYRTEDNTNSIKIYTQQFSKLVNILKGDTKLTVIKESNLVDISDYFEKASMYSDLIHDYLEASDYSQVLGVGVDYDRLLATGWRGNISYEQRNHYRDMYQKLDENLSASDATRMLSDYLGGAKARVDLKGTAKPETSYGFIQISFTPPVPGSPATIAQNNVYWRTVPSSDGRTHISPWRAKGYLVITTDNVVRSKITSFQNTELISELECDSVTISNEKHSVEVKVDYIIQDVLSEKHYSVLK